MLLGKLNDKKWKCRLHFLFLGSADQTDLWWIAVTIQIGLFSVSWGTRISCKSVIDHWPNATCLYEIKIATFSMLTTVLTSNIVNWLLHIINLYMKLSCLPYVLSFLSESSYECMCRSSFIFILNRIPLHKRITFTHSAIDGLLQCLLLRVIIKMHLYALFCVYSWSGIAVS